jgi:hypothetical protein
VEEGPGDRGPAWGDRTRGRPAHSALCRFPPRGRNLPFRRGGPASSLIDDETTSEPLCF